MANYYVNITEDNGVGDGTSPTNYWGWNEFSARTLSGVLPLSNDSYYMKGYRQVSQNLIFSADGSVTPVSIDFYGWDGNSFILDFTDSYQMIFSSSTSAAVGNVEIQNMITNVAAIRQNDDGFDSTLTLINCLIIRGDEILTIEGTYNVGVNGTGFDFCGCTINAKGIDINYKGQYEFENCLLTSGTTISASMADTHLQLRGCSIVGISNIDELTANSPNTFTDIDNENNIYDAIIGASFPSSTELQTLSGDAVRELLNFTAFSTDNTLSGNISLWNMYTTYVSSAFSTSGYINGASWSYRYGYGFKGTPRRGVGAFYFGGPYYVDLDLANPDVFNTSLAGNTVNLSARGSEDDPFNYAQFFLATQIYHGWETWKFKGSINITSAIGGLFTSANSSVWIEEFANFLYSGTDIGEYIFEAWNLSANGLWRVGITSADSDVDSFNSFIYDDTKYTNITIRDALISLSGNDIGAALMRTPILPVTAVKDVTFYNSQIYLLMSDVNYPHLFYGDGANNRKFFYGCNIVINTGDVNNTFQWGTAPITIQNCIFKAGISYDFDNYATSAITIQNTETNLTEVNLGDCTLSGNVYESTALSTIPDTIDISTFDKNDFIYYDYNITVVAYDDFTDYPTGIGGLTRNGVGAFYFLSTSSCFSADVSAGTIPLTVIFTTERGSTLTDKLYTWNFGDGDVSSTTSASITHVFTSAGNFTVQLIITGMSADVAPYATYIEEDFNTIQGQATAMDPAWDPNFSAGALFGGVLNASGQLYSACCGAYGTFMNGSTPDWIIASADYIGGDFNFETTIMWNAAAGGDSHHFYFTSAYGDTGTLIVEHWWMGGTLHWDTKSDADETTSVAASAWNCIWLKVQRIDGEISAAYRRCQETEWTWFANTQTFSGDLWVYTDTYTDNGIGFIGFSADEGLPYNATSETTAAINCSGIIIANEVTIGHIGAFYFGPIDVSSTFLPNMMEIAAYTPTVYGEQSSSASVPSTASFLLIRAFSPSVYIFNGLRIWFVGTPRKGISPLCVDFEAFVEWHPAYIDRYRITEYKWWFDYANYSNPEDGVVSECGGEPSSTISHVYQGGAGRSFDVRLCVQIAPV